MKYSHCTSFCFKRQERTKQRTDWAFFKGPLSAWHSRSEHQLGHKSRGSNLLLCLSWATRDWTGTRSLQQLLGCYWQYWLELCRQQVSNSCLLTANKLSKNCLLYWQFKMKWNLSMDFSAEMGLNTFPNLTFLTNEHGVILYFCYCQ